MKHVGYWVDTEDGEPEDRLLTIGEYEDCVANEGGLKPEYVPLLRKVYTLEPGELEQG
jgi:hypothetical protein